MKTWVMEMSLWIWGLMFSMLGGSFLLLNSTKQDKGTCQAMHNGVSDKLELLDKKIDKLLDLHLKNSSD